MPRLASLCDETGGAERTAGGVGLCWHRTIEVGPVKIGSEHPIALQTMTCSDTRDVKKTVEEVMRCADAGADMVRITVQGMKEADACHDIREELFKLRCVIIPFPSVSCGLSPAQPLGEFPVQAHVWNVATVCECVRSLLCGVALPRSSHFLSPRFLVLLRLDVHQHTHTHVSSGRSHGLPLSACACLVAFHRPRSRESGFCLRRRRQKS